MLRSRPSLRFAAPGCSEGRDSRADSRANLLSPAKQSYLCREVQIPLEPDERPPVARVVREGVRMRHSRRCGLLQAEGCSCTPSFQAQVWSARDRKQLRRTFLTLAEAVAWRHETQVAVHRGTVRGPDKRTVGEAAEQWLAAAEAGVVRTRSGDPFKPSALRSYRQALRTRLLPALGRERLDSLTRNHIQDLIDQLVAQELSPSTIRNTILPLRAIYRQALARDEIAVNPTARLALPAVRSRRNNIVSPQTGAALIAALPPTDQALWATALYAGLRRGELQALTWHNINLDHGLINVAQSWDMRAGLIPPKSRAGNRRVPLTDTLRHHLINHKLQSSYTQPTDYVFANQHGRPFNPTTTLNRAATIWHNNNLQPICLHDCRHSYAAFMIAAGINAKALSTYMGHSTITTTLDRYGHLLPGNEHQAATLLETLLTNQTTASVTTSAV